MLLNLWLLDVHIKTQKCHNWTYWTLQYFGVKFLDKWKVTYLIKQALHVSLIESINWLSLYHSYNWIKCKTAIFIYQQIIALKKLRKMLFYLCHLKTFFFSFSRFKFLYLSHPFFFSSHCLRRWYKLLSNVHDINWLYKN